MGPGEVADDHPAPAGPVPSDCPHPQLGSRDFHTAAPLTPELIDEEKIDHHVFPARIPAGPRPRRGTRLGPQSRPDRPGDQHSDRQEPSVEVPGRGPSVLGDGLDAVLAKPPARA